MLHSLSANYYQWTELFARRERERERERERVGGICTNREL